MVIFINYLEAISRTCFLIPHFILFPLFAFPPAGAVDKIVLPEGMQSVDFYGCEGLTGTADSSMSDGHIYLIRFGGQPHALPHSSLHHFFLPLPPPLQVLSTRSCSPRACRK